MLKCDCLKDVNFLNNNYYGLYSKGKSNVSWDSELDWSLAGNDVLPEYLKSIAIDVASMSAHVEILGMQNAAELLVKCSDFSLKIGLGQAVNDEARHAELFAKYALLANGRIRDFTKTKDIYDSHFDDLKTFDEVFLSHVFLENGALEQFNIFIYAFGEESLIGKIYRGALQDEARHVQMGILYFREKILRDDKYMFFLDEHLNKYSSLLKVNDKGIQWLSELSKISELELRNRINKRQSSFINKLIQVGSYV